jgi:hypothetical protein
MPLQHLLRRARWLQALLLLAALHHGAAQAGAATCQAIVTLSTNWVQTSDNVSFASITLNIVDAQATAVSVPWTLTLKNPAYGMIKQVSIPTSHCHHMPAHGAQMHVALCSSDSPRYISNFTVLMQNCLQWCFLVSLSLYRKEMCCDLDNSTLSCTYCMHCRRSAWRSSPAGMGQ